MTSHEITIFTISLTSLELGNSKFPGKLQNCMGLEPSIHVFTIVDAPEELSPDEEVRLTCRSL